MFALVVWIVVCSQTVAAQSTDIEGQPCYHVTKNLTGTCTHLANCRSALDDIDNQIFPQVCSLADTAPIVCCPKVPVGYKSRAKCLEYSKLQLGECNIQYDRSKNVTDALGKEFPHMILLGYSKPGEFGRKYMCSGSLISERFVLTAAYCVFDVPKYVRLGELDLANYDDDAEPQDLLVERVFSHPGYDEVTANDIALVKLEKNVEFTPYVRPACLHAEHEFNIEDDLLSGGWVRPEFETRQSMRRSLLRFVETDDCAKKREHKIDDEIQFCAEDQSCYGDWGGSLQTKRDDVECMYDLIGISSAFWKCPESLPLRTSVYTRISHYIEWIEGIVWP